MTLMAVSGVIRNEMKDKNHLNNKWHPSNTYRVTSVVGPDLVRFQPSGFRSVSPNSASPPISFDVRSRATEWRKKATRKKNNNRRKRRWPTADVTRRDLLLPPPFRRKRIETILNDGRLHRKGNDRTRSYPLSLPCFHLPSPSEYAISAKRTGNRLLLWAGLFVPSNGPGRKKHCCVFHNDPLEDHSCRKINVFEQKRQMGAGKGNELPCVRLDWFPFDFFSSIVCFLFQCISFLRLSLLIVRWTTYWIVSDPNQGPSSSNNGAAKCVRFPIWFGNRVGRVGSSFLVVRTGTRLFIASSSRRQ